MKERGNSSETLERPTREERNLEETSTSCVLSYCGLLLTPTYASKRKASGLMIDTHSLKVAGHGLSPGCLTLTYVLLAISHTQRLTCPCGKCQQPHAPCLTPIFPHWGIRHGLLQFFSRTNPGKTSWPFRWPATAKLSPLPGHLHLSKKFVPGSQRFLCPVTPGTLGKNPRSLYWRLFLSTLHVCGRWEHSSK